MTKLSASPKAPAVARVYDILNCGPRNRFAANGRLVHNSGGGSMNWQNLPGRGDGAEIRKAIIPPPNHKIVVGDSSNIELRVAMAAAGQWDVVEKIARGMDLYCDFAGRLYKRDITKADEKERLIGKIAMLSLQYGAGWQRYQEMVRIMGKLTISAQEAQDVVGLYRELHKELTKLWRHCQDVVLPTIANRGLPVAVDVNGWALTTDTGFGVPGELQIRYENLRKNTEGEWVYTMGREDEVRIYGPKVVENLSQYLARLIVLAQTVNHHRRFPVALSVHDEAVCVVEQQLAEQCAEHLLECLRWSPGWTRDLIPLTGEVGIGDSYGEAK